MSKSRSAKAAEIRRLMRTEGEAVATNTRGFNLGRYESVADLEDYEGLKEEARAIKEDAIERLPELIDQLTETVEANGGTVYIADDAADANRYVQEVCADKEAERVVKSKSMTSEELEVNEALEADGVEVVETDLGEWVLQVADEAPSHIVAPAIHKSRAEIADLFNSQFADELDEELETAEELTMFAREQLGELIEGADVGMTGANFITADTGTLALVTSEGNARKSAVVPDTHVAVAGVEKVVPSVEDLQPFVELIGRSGTGQDITSYISLLTPPVESPPVDFDEPDTPMAEGEHERDFHLVLVDNGRMEMREDEHLKETLYCIRCSACSNVCGNFQSVGGHAFGGETYSGGIATGWEAGIEGLDTAAEFNDLCTGCSRCVNACPVGIDIPWINTVVRDRVNRGESAELDWLVEGLTPDEEPGGMDLQKRFFGNFSTLAKLGSATAPVSNWLADTRPARAAMERVLGIDRRRELPSFQRETLVDWFEARGGPRVDAADAEREAVLYPDLYTNHVQVSRGKAAVRTLEALGVHVQVPDVASSGRAPLSQGMVSTAERHAHEVYAALAEHIDGGRDIVLVEPSDLAMFDREYEKFLAPASQERLSENSYEVMEYVYGLLHNGADASALRGAGEGREAVESVAYHSHCQQRTLGLEAHTVHVLEDLGYDVLASETECCGMAGSFGYKSEYYELSMDVGEPLREQFGADEERTVVASGTSCLEQLDALLSRPTQHPVELLAP
ncbi:iron-sulfur cluster-binding protein [Halogranum gelatinilyticum]|uniref:Iron-sulfur cluster-binding protein n=1 Tax=Halogranum gelatinilyticum TaxID=660521 RepID=A0A1G9YYS2_9EURY|nr:LUD domain-containing protein [Halogranum gelatinilyticum]SDN14067.1 iron-sulfur cluster-binding protein [Halogranum gelatinilyticum]